MKTGAARLRAASCPPSTPRCCSAACSMRRRYFDAEPSRRGGDPRPGRRRSTGASTGNGRRCRRRHRQHGLEAGDGLHPVRLGRATTRPCWSYCWRSARPPTPSARAPGPPGPSSYEDAWGRFMGYEHLSFAPAVRPPVLARVDRLPRHPGRDMRERDIDYFENIAPRGLRAAGLRDRQSEGLVRVRRRTSGASPRATAPARCACSRPQGPGPLLPRLLGARRRPLVDTIDDGTIAPTAARLVPAVRARDRDPGRSRRCTRAMASSSTRVRLRRFVQPQLHRHRRRRSRRPGRARRSAGSPPTTSASTRVLSWR